MPLIFARSHWFRITLHVPPEWSDAERVQFEFDPSCEAMIFDTEGCPIQGITGGYGGDRRVEFILPKTKAGSYKCASPPPAPSRPQCRVTHSLTPRADYAEVSCNAMFGNGLGETNGPPDMNRFFRVRPFSSSSSSSSSYTFSSLPLRVGLTLCDPCSSRAPTSSCRAWRRGACSGTSGASSSLARLARI